MLGTWWLGRCNRRDRSWMVDLQLLWEKSYFARLGRIRTKFNYCNTVHHGAVSVSSFFLHRFFLVVHLRFMAWVLSQALHLVYSKLLEPVISSVFFCEFLPLVLFAKYRKVKAKSPSDPPFQRICIWGVCPPQIRKLPMDSGTGVCALAADFQSKGCHAFAHLSAEN